MQFSSDLWCPQADIFVKRRQETAELLQDLVLLK